MNTVTNPANRFTDLVDDYARYRPRYPVEVLDLLWRKCRLDPTCVVADIGSGTGILTELLLSNGNMVYAVEPNAKMREMAENRLGHYVRFRSIAGTAEATTLDAGSVHLIVAGQAFHWFDLAAARKEFVRIGGGQAWLALLWNDHLTVETPFARDYEKLLQEYSVDYQKVNHRNLSVVQIREFFRPGRCEVSKFNHTQKLDWTGLLGRLRSTSYIPRSDDVRYTPMLSALRRIFQKHNQSGIVNMEYQTKVYYGQLQ